MLFHKRHPLTLSSQPLILPPLLRIHIQPPLHRPHNQENRISLDMSQDPISLLLLPRHPTNFRILIPNTASNPHKFTIIIAARRRVVSERESAVVGALLAVRFDPFRVSERRDNFDRIPGFGFFVAAFEIFDVGADVAADDGGAVGHWV